MGIIHRVLAIGLVCAGLALAGCRSVESTSNEPRLVERVLESDRRLAYLPESGSKLCVSVRWNVQKVDGSLVDPESPMEGAWEKLAPVIRWNRDGELELFVRRGRFSIPENWEFLVVHLSTGRYLSTGEFRNESDIPISMRFDNPLDGGWFDLRGR